MPAVGDQHKPNGATTANPFEETKPRCTEYTAQEIATLQSRLDKQLGPEYISSRPGAAGQKVHYLAAEKVINLANEIFGFNGWSSSIQNIQIDFVDENAQTGKITLGLSVIVRVTLKDGTYHEDIGYGHIENCKGKAAAFEKAKKEGTTDALKRALRTFGNVLGNCVYDKDYVQKVTKVKVGAGRWDVEALHRHPDFVPRLVHPAKAITAAPTSNDSSNQDSVDSFDLADFDDAEFDDSEFYHPDEVVLPAEPGEGWPGQKPDHMKNGAVTTPQSNRTNPSVGSALRPPGQNLRSDMRSNSPQVPHQNGQPAGPPSAMRPPAAQLPNTNQALVNNNQRSSSPGIPSEHFPPAPLNPNIPPDHRQINRPAGFYSAKAATHIDAENNLAAPDPKNLPVFNPHAESPSIRKTAGVDHSKSTKLKRDYISEIVPSKPPTDQKQDMDRRPGNALPGQTAPGLGPRMMSGSAFRPVTRRGLETHSNATNTASSAVVPGGVDRVLAAAGRTPLGDVSNIQHHVTATTVDGQEAKRQKTGGLDAVVENSTIART